MRYALYLCFVFCLVGLSLAGQKPAAKAQQESNPKEDLVVLTTGRKIRGVILKYELEKAMLFKESNGNLMTIPAEVIDKFIVGAREAKLDRLFQLEKPFLEPGGFYNNFALFVPFGAETTSNSGMGMGFEYTLGLQVNSRFGVGLGTGMNFMFGNFSDRLVPVVAEIRYYNSPLRRHRAYALIDSGYSVGWASEKINDAYHTNGGWRIHPALGVVWNKASSMRLSTELGFLHQRASLVEDYWESSKWLKANDYRMNRWLFKVGLLF